MFCALAAAAALSAHAAAHEVLPSIADLSTDGGSLTLQIRASVEGFMAGFDLSTVENTDAAPDVARYEKLRELPAADLSDRFRIFWPVLADAMSIVADGEPVPPRLVGLSVGDASDPSMTRHSVIAVEANLPPGTEWVSIGWEPRFGALVLRQVGVAEPYQGYLTPGQISPPIPLAGSGGPGGFFGTFMTYVKVGFIHILPRGPDHILFVLGLFFLAPRLSPLLWQVSAFTAAHTLALALAASGLVSVPSGIVEPAIAASIVFIAFENLRSGRMSLWRPLTVFGFGLLHGLGFAGVLAEFGLPRDGFVAALAGFNLGVEIAQVAIVLAAFILIGSVFGRRQFYRSAVAVPASVAIGAVGAIWTFDRIWGLPLL